MTRIETSIDERGRHRAYEFASEIPLGIIVELSNGAGWMSSFLSARAAGAWARGEAAESLSTFQTLTAARLELGRWADRHPEEMARMHRELIAARSRATSPEPLEEMPAAPVLQGGMF